MSFSYNHATLIGRLTRDPETKELDGDNAKTVFTLAVNRTPTKKSDKEETDFMNIIAWGKLAKISSKYLKKGMPVLIDGRIQIRVYEKDKEKHWMTEVVAENMQILETLKSQN